MAIGGFWFIQTPDSWYSYSISVFLVLATVMETTVVDCILLRVSDREIRGVVFGTATASGYMGQFVFSMVGGLLFD
jgi:hypothetical protein